MRIKLLLALATLSLGAMSNSCEKDNSVSPDSAVITGRIVKIETTVDETLKNLRSRWLVDVAPLSFAGLAGKPYQQVKVFNLPDTLSYKVGRSLTFHYQLVPEAQQTLWKTLYEWHSLPPNSPGLVPLPELLLTEPQLLPIR